MSKRFKSNKQRKYVMSRMSCNDKEIMEHSREHAIIRKCRRESDVERGALIEHKEHPQLSISQSREVARQHLKENPDAYGEYI